MTICGTPLTFWLSTTSNPTSPTNFLLLLLHHLIPPHHPSSAEMSTRKGRRNNNPHGHPQHNNQSQHPNPQLTDYESDAYFSDMQHQQAQAAAAAAAAAVTAAEAPSRSNEEINLSVIRRHNPSVTAIISLAPYVVVYIFSPTTKQWEKNGVEGSLFVCQQTPGRLGEDRYTAFVLNRRGLNNFDLPLTDCDNVEITEEYVILKADESPEGEKGENGIADPMNPQHGRAANGSNSPADVRIYGLWIYSEPPPNSTAETRTINAQLILECAAHAGNSLKLAQERLEAMRQNDLQVAAAAAETQAPPLEEIQASVPMGRQISLKDLFGQQRAQDDGWSVRAHHMSPAEIQMQMQMHQQQQQQQQQHQHQHQHQPGMAPPPQHYPQPGHYPQQHYPQQQASQPPPQPQGDVLGDLFRRAGLAYQG